MRAVVFALPALAIVLVGPTSALADPQDLSGIPEESTVGQPPPGELGYDPQYQTFYDQLSPYGEWIEREPYGQVWRPWPDQVGADFVPYASNGEWVYTDAGWSFSSSYPWGWATFHYGRWLMQPGLGWVWVPGKTWGPSWCDWRVSDGYVGWAPLPPVGFGVSLPFSAWTFVPTPYFVRPDFRRYAIPPYRVREVFYGARPYRDVRVYRGARYIGGPPPTMVSRAVGAPIRPVTIAPPRPGVVQPYRVPRAAWNAPGYRGPVNRGPATVTPQVRPAPRYGGPAYRGNPPQRTYVPGLYRREGAVRSAPQQAVPQRQPRTSFYRQPAPAPQAPVRAQPQPAPQQHNYRYRR